MLVCFVRLSLELFKKRGKKPEKNSLKLGSLSGVGFEDTKPRMTAKQEEKKILGYLPSQKVR